MLTAVLGTAIVAAVGLAVLGWRLAERPIEIRWLANRIEAAVDPAIAPGRLSIGSASLAWGGFRNGLDVPIVVRLTGMVLRAAIGTPLMEIPNAEVSLAAGPLLRGQIEPRAVEIERPSIAVERTTDGSLSVSVGVAGPHQGRVSASFAPALLAALTDSPGEAGLRRSLKRLRHLGVRDASLVIKDRQLGAKWRAPRVDIDINRAADGSMQGRADMALALGDQQARLSIEAMHPAASDVTEMSAAVSAVRPSALALAAQSLAPLAAIDAPVSGEIWMTLGPQLAPRHIRVSLRAGAGMARLGAGAVPFLGAAMVVAGRPRQLTLQEAHLDLRGHPGGLISQITAHGHAHSSDDGYTSDLSLDLNRVELADLPILWPAGVGGGARPWILENVTAGFAHDGHLDLGLAATDSLADVKLTRAAGRLQASDLTIHWLRPVPPVVNAAVGLRLVDPDTVEIDVARGQQGREAPSPERTGAPVEAGTLVLTGGLMRITGLMHKDQSATIETEVAGSVPDAIELLSDARLHLLSDHPLPLKNPTGMVTANLTVSLPLDARVTMDEVAVRARAKLRGVHLGGIAGEHDLDEGVFDLTADTDGLALAGQGDLADIPVVLDAALDFRAGPRSQIQERITVSGHPDALRLARAGLDASGVLSGPIGLKATYTERRSGQGLITAQADLATATLKVPLLDWRKPAGVEATAGARVVLDRGRITRIDHIEASGRALALAGEADFKDGNPTAFHLDRLVLGRTDVRGLVRLPRDGAPISARVSGRRLDLSAALAGTGRSLGSRPELGRSATMPSAPGWQVDGRFNNVILAGGRTVAGVSITAESDGRMLRQAKVAGWTGARSPFDLEIRDGSDGRILHADAADTGALLRDLGVLGDIDGGRLAISARFQDWLPGSPLVGTAELHDFRVRGAPVLGKLLQAMTLYGLGEALRGPGMEFSRLVAPFRLDDGRIELENARAFNPSIGLTAEGRIDLASGRLAIAGTVVPAYFFNTLLGRIPFVGRLFSLEKGGGIIAANYAVRGPLANPLVSVNPLSALTPGFLRGIFAGR